MNSLHRVGRLVFSATAMAGLLIATASAQEDEVVGTWNCSFSVEDAASGAAMSGDFVQTYGADGNYARTGEIHVMIAAFEVDLDISIEESGAWRMVDSMVLGETMSEIVFSSDEEAPSETEQMLLQQMEAEAAATVAEETYQITALTATTMDLNDGGEVTMSCQKAG